MSSESALSFMSFAQQLAQALQLEQVRFIKKQLLETQNPIYIEGFIAQSYQNADKILLRDFIKLEQLQAVIQKYAFELNLGPDILEFIGVAAQKIHHSAAHNSTVLNELLSDENFELWLFKILELEQLKTYLQDHLEHNPQIQHISIQLANQILEQNTPWLRQLRQYTVKQDHLRSKVLSFIQEQHQNLELKLEQQLAAAIRSQLIHIIQLPNEDLANLAYLIWSDLKQRPLKETFSQFQSIDFEEFFILVYETWKGLRQTDFMQHIILHVVAAFYEYFSEFSLQELLHSVGLNEHDLRLEAYRFIPSCIKALDEHDLLDSIIASLIAPFYQNEHTQQTIAHLMSTNLPFKA
ncbi:MULTISPECIES: hypothetical protein [unclassified Acinetobacter]|uniref:hypothetical protein n=1 Tax=unclassified Acinetobacter TaxID=196816 RepID=UPI002575777B|nr:MULTISPECIES: hypothetical protein [unclassified Acinetobacter]MDM1763408.1 hypothetical protein [Acinetobacter sp. 226-1]MDM1766887.1 hypothetical protein [Acinetobacter sp. 226-4]